MFRYLSVFNSFLRCWLISVLFVQFQEKYFRLLEFVVFQLSYVPCKELISLSLLLRNHAATHTQCSIQCMVVLLTILR